MGLVDKWYIKFACALSALSIVTPMSYAQTPRDPGVRLPADLSRIGGLSCTDVTKPIPGLTAGEEKLFCAGAEEFAKIDQVKDDGLGPTMNFTSCLGCHQYPSSGGSSPLGMNPQYDFGNSYPAGTNVIPPFVLPNGPVRVARFKKHPDGSPDGGVHSLFTITGLPGAEGCILKQEDFQQQIKDNNIIYRIPTPTFGAGLIEQIDDKTIEENVKAQAKLTYGEKQFSVPAGRLNIVQPHHVRGSENRNGNDGTIARFGWKAQNKSLLIFAGEAYNVEMGISNEVFPNEREEKKECQFHTVPNDTSHPEKLFEQNPQDRLDALGDVAKFAGFMRFLAPPEPSIDTPGGATSIQLGSQVFARIGCSSCHTPELKTSPLSSVTALRNKPVRLYSDLALHKMGSKLEDGISQGQAAGDEFRSAPLWGLGQRVYFLHDGRTSDLVEAILAHADPKSDANEVIALYNMLSVKDKQDLLNFLRSL